MKKQTYCFAHLKHPTYALKLWASFLMCVLKETNGIDNSRRKQKICNVSHNKVQSRLKQMQPIWLEKKHENLKAVVRNWEILAAIELKMTCSDNESEQEHARHFLYKTCN